MMKVIAVKKDLTDKLYYLWSIAIALKSYFVDSTLKVKIERRDAETQSFQMCKN